MLLKIKLLNNITNLLQYTFKHNVTKNSILHYLITIFAETIEDLINEMLCISIL